LQKDEAAQVTFRLRQRSRARSMNPTTHIDQASPALSPAARALCLALYFDDLLKRLEVENHADIACRFCVSRERVSQIMKLLLLAPRLQMGILSGSEILTEAEARQLTQEITWREQYALTTRR
jgi:hypothetical protein